MPASKAQQKAVSKYMKENYDMFQIRMPKGRKPTIQSHAEAQGESANGFINRAIMETMERDTAGTAVEAAGAPPGEGLLSFHDDTLQAAQEAAEAAGETVPQFVDRAIEETADRDAESQEVVFNRAVEFLAEYFKMNKWDFIKELEQIKKKASGKTTRKTKGGKPNEQP